MLPPKQFFFQRNLNESIHVINTFEYSFCVCPSVQTYRELELRNCKIWAEICFHHITFSLLAPKEKKGLCKVTLSDREKFPWKLPHGESGQLQHKEERLQIQIIFSARTHQVPSNNVNTCAWSWHFGRINKPVVPVVSPIWYPLLMEPHAKRIGSISLEEVVFSKLGVLVLADKYKHSTLRGQDR